MDIQTRNLLRELQDSFKLETRPFKRIANKLGCSEEEVIKIIQDCLDKGIIKRIGAAIKPEKLGYAANALVVWQVSPDKIDEVGKEVAKMAEVSHVYERETPSGWPYNFFTMIHAHNQSELQGLINQIAKRYNIDEYKVYETEVELKKTSMRYFLEEENDN